MDVSHVRINYGAKPDYTFSVKDIIITVNNIVHSILLIKEKNQGQHKKSTLQRRLYTSIVRKNSKEIYLGKYLQEQTDDEPILWRVLTSDKKGALLVTKFCLDCKRFNDEYKQVIWGKSTLRRWLNDEFYNRAFNSVEKSIIKETNLEASINPEFGTSS